LDGYLATTPGGLYVVLATAVSGSANAGFVLSVQLLRTFLMLLAAPPLVRLLVRRGTTSSFVGVELAPAASAMGCANSPSSLGGAEIQS
jgi:Transition state regulatory protein AbrB